MNGLKQTLAFKTLAVERQTHASSPELTRRWEPLGDKGLQDPCAVTQEFAHSLASEAAAGVEPAMKVLQTSAEFSGPTPELLSKITKMALPADQIGRADFCLSRGRPDAVKRKGGLIYR